MDSNFEIHISDNDVTNGTVAVSWCVSKELLEELSLRKIKDPAVVLMTCSYDEETHHTKKEYRKVVRLKDLMTYVEFRSSGKNKIWAFVNKLHDFKTVRSTYLRRNDHGIFQSPIVYENLPTEYVSSEITSFLAEPLEVEVPTGVFAAEPSQWEKDWVNLFAKTEPIDQCDFRRRRLFAYTLQPSLALVIWAVAFLIPFIFGCLIGSRNLSYKPMLSPIKYGASAGIDVVSGGTVFINQNKEGWQRYAKLIFMPLVLMGLTGLIYGIIKSLVVLKMLAVVIAVAITILAVGFGLFLYETKKAAEPAWFVNEEEQKLIMCSQDKVRPMTVSDLPKEKRTWRLKFQEAKSRICRPYSA